MIGCGGGVEDTVDGNQGSSQASHFIDHLLLWQQAIKKESKKGKRFFDDMSFKDNFDTHVVVLDGVRFG